MDRFVASLAALGQAARLTIFRLLVRAGPNGCCVDDIRQQLRMPGSTLSHHLDALARCGLIASRRDGRFIYYAVDWPKTAELIRFLTEDCCADLHRRLAPSAEHGPGTAASELVQARQHARRSRQARPSARRRAKTRR